MYHNFYWESESKLLNQGCVNSRLCLSCQFCVYLQVSQRVAHEHDIFPALEPLEVRRIVHCALILVEDVNHVSSDAGNVSLSIVCQEVTDNFNILAH